MRLATGGLRSRVHRRYRDALWHFSDLHPGDLGALFYIENGDIVAVGAADAAIFAVWRKDYPIRTVACVQSSCNLLRFKIININAVVEEAGYP